MPSAQPEPMSLLRQLAYACGSPGFQLSDRIVVGILIYYYLPPGGSELVPQITEDVLFAGLTAFGVAMLVGRVFDSVADPVVGFLSDRSVSRIGGKAQHPRIKEEAGRIKLDYLQFLELEVFSRFGARLEASMEEAIRRGNVLREILKQERLAPLPAEFHMAWLVAFNDGLFDAIDVDSIPVLLDSLRSEIEHSTRTLGDPRQDWADTVSAWLDVAQEQSPK
jgi:hypothetical protein